MGRDDPQHLQDRQRLAKIYAEMDESELEDTAYHAGRFNDVARQALKEAIAARGLDIKVEADFKRPRSVTILALLAFLNAAFYVLLVVLAFTRPELIPTFTARHSPPPHFRHLPPPQLEYDIVAVAGYSIVAAIYVCLGFALWSLYWGARLAAMYLAGGSLVRWGYGLVTTLLFGTWDLGPAFTTVRPIGLLLSGAILYILTQPEVERVFTKIPGVPNWPWGW